MLLFSLIFYLQSFISFKIICCCRVYYSCWVSNIEIIIQYIPSLEITFRLVCKFLHFVLMFAERKKEREREREREREILIKKYVKRFTRILTLLLQFYKSSFFVRILFAFNCLVCINSKGLYFCNVPTQILISYVTFTILYRIT